MHKLENIINYMVRAVRVLESMGKDDPIFVFSHIDTDGITSAVIIAKLLIEMNKPFILNFFPQISNKSFESYWQEVEPRYVIFLDLGTDTPLAYVKKTASISSSIIIDHHIVSSSDFSDPFSDPRSLVINPRLCEIDGSTEISSAGITFLLANTFYGFFDRNKAHLFYAITGALGDSQDVGPKRSLIGINKFIVNYGERYGVINSYEDYILIGMGFKPLYRLLAEMFILDIPGISGSYEGAVDFLIQAGVLRRGDDPEKVYWDKLTPEQRDVLRNKLLEALVLKHCGKYSIREIDEMLRGYVYEFSAGQNHFCRYARDLSILINACGKMRSPEVAFGALLNPLNKDVVQQVFQLYERYRAVLSTIFLNMESQVEMHGSVAVYDGRDKIHEELTSSVASILAHALKSTAKIIIVLSRSVENALKVSIRGTNAFQGNLVEILKKVLSNLPEASGGGHELAAGAYLPEEKLESFLAAMERLLE
ncbi:MAG: DHHA1 domain-containing protein [Crenarchaeota archaeon]|nr:DHHA1 domain-containing protein [Thermoproteota archaeon]MCR8455330.1 DHHA1 domain-containing protein [Thermoproteota archaeon]MCR8501385.1 DHHA1 domain-containing protein [Thermoproteota archaeon]